MNFTSFTTLALIALTLSACSVKNDKTQINGIGLTYQTDVTVNKNGDYSVDVEAAPGAGRISGAEGASIKIAAEYCQAKNKAVKLLKNETDSHMLINGVSRLTFRCV